MVPEVSKALELRERLSGKSVTLDTDGRPKLHLTGAEIADLALETGCMIGPSHAFTPWTGIYAYYKTLSDCYLEHADKIPYIELGLSADTNYVTDSRAQGENFSHQLPTLTLRGQTSLQESSTRWRWRM
jgi:PHP family Zn ribbon phosphoesterase